MIMFEKYANTLLIVLWKCFFFLRRKNCVNKSLQSKDDHLLLALGLLIELRNDFSLLKGSIFFNGMNSSSR
jgi:hypothetical protein